VVIATLCVSRNNPKALMEALVSHSDTAMDATSRFVAVLDADDPRLHEYAEMLEDVSYDLCIVPRDRTGWMNLALNYAALIYAERVDVVGFIGDDHRFRTKGWDRIVGKVLSDQGGGFVYGNDLYMGDHLPTQVFVSSPIVRALGWMGLPEARHLYLDNTWKYLGENSDSLFYLPDIIIEHMHPVAGKGEWDDNHKRVNTDEMYGHDRHVYEEWVAFRGPADVEKVRLALHS
jgi:hypothetical protein